jgi:hypothetical protein
VSHAAAARRRAPLAAATLLALVLLAPTEGGARPGGGGSFGGGGGSRSGSSSSSSSSGGSRSGSTSSSTSSAGGASTAVEPVWLYRATSGRSRSGPRAPSSTDTSPYGEPPPRPAAWPAPNVIDNSALGAVLLMVPAAVLLVIGLALYLLVRGSRRRAGTGWSTVAVRAQGRSELTAIQATDPDFSIALFEDFLYALFTEAHVARGAHTLERLSPFLRPEVRAALAARTSAPVGSIVVGAMRFVQFVTQDPSRYAVQVEFEANYAEGAPGQPERAYWVTERWWLSRARAARSRGPDRARVFDCPGCGAPLDKVIGGQCRHCNRTVDTGEFDWRVEGIEVTSLQPRGPMLTGTTEEVGTDLPTIVDPALQARLAALSARDRAFDLGALERRVGLVFATMQSAWASLAWHKARPFLSDNLFETQRYWIEAYRRAGLRNVTERARILRIDLARVTHDRFFDAVTLRVYATGLDYTLRDADGAVVGGNRARERVYSEYWTLLRSVAASGPARAEPVCPRCGAGLEVTMAGDCTHCKAKVNSGSFDWVLARIEQDEAYTG